MPGHNIVVHTLSTINICQLLG